MERIEKLPRHGSEGGEGGGEGECKINAAAMWDRERACCVLRSRRGPRGQRQAPPSQTWCKREKDTSISLSLSFYTRQPTKAFVNIELPSTRRQKENVSNWSKKNEIKHTGKIISSHTVIHS